MRWGEGGQTREMWSVQSVVRPSVVGQRALDIPMPIPVGAGTVPEARQLYWGWGWVSDDGRTGAGGTRWEREKKLDWADSSASDLELGRKIVPTAAAVFRVSWGRLGVA